MELPENVKQQRDVFPSALAHAEGCFRSGLDALLLAAFAAREFGHPGARALKNRRRGLVEGPEGAFAALDEGCGSGFALLALEMLREDMKGAGVDMLGAQIEAAKENARRLALDGRCRWHEGDLSEFSKALGAPCFDLALFNPPYWAPGDGRASPKESNEHARRGKEGTLEAFCMAAKRALVHHGPCYCVYPAGRLVELACMLEKTGFGMRKLLAVHAKKGKEASRVLVEARKGANSDLKILPPLVLYRQNPDGGEGAGNLPTQAALRLCPWIR